MPSEGRRPFSCRLPEHVHEALVDVAAAMGVSQTEVVVLAIKAIHCRPEVRDIANARQRLVAFMAERTGTAEDPG